MPEDDGTQLLDTNETLEMIKIHSMVVAQLLNYNRELIQIISDDNKQARDIFYELVREKLK